jgi:hypothetical protein
MTSQQPPDGAYEQQSRPSFTPCQQGEPPYAPPQGQAPYQQPQEAHYGQRDMQPATQDRKGYPPDQQSYPQVPQSDHRGRRGAGGKQYALRGAESFWYVLGCIGFGAAYFAKLPGKEAACEVFSELQLDGQGPSRRLLIAGGRGVLVRADVPPVRCWLLREGVGEEGAMGGSRHGAVRAWRVCRGDQPNPFRGCRALPAEILISMP